MALGRGVKRTQTQLSGTNEQEDSFESESTHRKKAKKTFPWV